MDRPTAPRFRVDRTKKKRPRVYLQCSKCEVDIREIKPADKVSVVVAHYCRDCDDGVTYLNQGKSE